MSSPVVAGIVSLMLQANPNLTPTQVIEILKTTALHDNYTGPATANGNNTWGHGKVNAFAAVAKAIQYLGTENIPSQIAGINIYPNPNKGAFIIKYNSVNTETIAISIADIAGRIVTEQQAKVNTGINEIPCNMLGYTNGWYVVTLKSPSHGSKVTKVSIQ